MGRTIPVLIIRDYSNQRCTGLPLVYDGLAMSLSEQARGRAPSG